MSSFSVRMAETHVDLLDRLRPHRFFVALAREEIPEERVRGWLCQEQHWGREYLNSLSHLCGRAPKWMRRALLETMLNIQGHFDLFEEQIAEAGVCDPTTTAPEYPARALAVFFLATAHTATVEEAVASEAAFNRFQFLAFSGGKAAQERPCRWQGMIEPRSDSNYHTWVGRIEEFADRACEESSERTRARMEKIYPLTARFLIQYYDHCLRAYGP
ncbi:MAG: hypothetical protein GF328_13560 [Candidatus Latescibacteria bacterium]|nr:hypothetical protein [Candidatus Latescibacterota bacterium]